MKRIATIFLASVLLAQIFTGCTPNENDSKENSRKKAKTVYVENTMYAHSFAGSNALEEVTFVLNGEIPAKNAQNGNFSGYIKVTQVDETTHTYEKLQYVWQDGLLLLYRGNPTEEDGEGVLCWVDPQAPEKTVIADRNWCQRNPQAEIIAYVNNDLSDAESRSLGTQINRIEAVYNTQYVSAEEALENFVTAQGDGAAFDGVDASYLRDRFLVTVSTEDVQETVEKIKEIDGIEDVVTAATWALESLCVIAPEQEFENVIELIMTLPELRNP